MDSSVKGRWDFCKAIITFSLAHSQLLAYATNLSLEKIAQSSGQLFEKITSIESVLSEISVISTQAQLLSFNASIEAARAGVAGKGFSVVATEIGRFAQQTKQCTDKVDVANQTILQEARTNADASSSMQSELKKFSESSESLRQNLTGITRFDESDGIISLLAKRLENHADFIRNLINNAGKLDKVTDHHGCALGKWYDAHVDRYRSIPAFVSLYATHKAFHKTAIQFNQTLSIESILQLVDISHTILKNFLDLADYFEQHGEPNP